MVNVNYDLLDAVRLMRNRGVRRLPVVNERRHLLGIVTMDDLLTAFSAEVGDMAGTVQKEFNLEEKVAVTDTRKLPISYEMLETEGD
jgi:CBS domain-containing protein